MDVLFIVRDASASSLVGTILTALQAQQAGRTVSVLITQDALAALARGTFAWPRELSGQTARLTLADRGAAMGVPLLGRGEGRQLDPKGLVTRARDAGIPLYACPVWSSLLGLDGAPPAGLQAVASGTLAELLCSARQVVGSL